MKKVLSALLALALVLMLPVTSFAASSKTYVIGSWDGVPQMSNNPIDPAPASHPYMEQINALELAPVRNEAWGDAYYQRLYSVITDDMTNFQKLWAVYDDVVVNYDKNANCVAYAAELDCAIQSLGFETYNMRGLVTTVGGGWTAHSWVGVNVGGKLLYFDANLPGRYGSPTATYFGADPNSIGSYKDAFVRVMELKPNDNAWLLKEEIAIPSELS